MPPSVVCVLLLVLAGLLDGCGGTAATNQGVRDTIQRWDHAMATGDYHAACGLTSPSYEQLVQLGAASTGLDPAAVLNGPPDCPRELRWLATGNVKYAPAYVLAVRRVQVKQIRIIRTSIGKCARVRITCITASCEPWVPLTLCYVSGWKLIAPL